MFAEFTKEMKETHTILCPNMLPMHMELLKMVFKSYGYNIEVLNYEGKQVIDTGLKYIHNDMCYPAVCTLGQQLYALTCGDYDPHKVALIQYQTGGGCRASNYIFLLRKALENMGMDYVPVLSVNLKGMEKMDGFKITLPMITRALSSIIYGDMMLLLKNQCLPYEDNPGDTRKVIDKWIEEIRVQFEDGKVLNKKVMKKNLEAMAKDFADIPKTYTKKTKVGVVGEIYVKYSSFGNNGLEEFLISQGCEVMVPGLLGFFQAGFANGEIDYNYYGGSIITKKINEFAEKAAWKYEEMIIDALKPYPQFTAPMDFNEVKKLADTIIDRGVKMGEGWLLPGEAAELIELGYPNVISAQPFGCLPNHIIAKGTIRRIRELYPQANVFPIDYDAGASKVNQENRIKLMLAIANEEASEN